MKKEMKIMLVVLGMSTALVGCGNSVYGDSSSENTLSESTSIAETMSEVETDNSSMTESADGLNEEDILKNYSGVQDLLSDADCIVKAEVLGAEVKNVRSYIYTSYQIEVLDTLYGSVQESSQSLTDGLRNAILTLNLPGGTLEGESYSAMIDEVTDGKDSGSISNTDSITSDGNTDRLLKKGDVAYFFLTPESEDAYAAVGEYKGVAFVEDNKVILNAEISDADQEITEDDFVNLIQKLVEGTSIETGDN